MKTSKIRIISYLKNSKLLGSLVAVFGFAVGTYAFTGPPVNCNPDNCSIPLIQDFINQRVGIGTSTPETTLDVSGNIKVGNNSDTCDSNTEGSIRYNLTTKDLEFCNGSSWKIAGNGENNPPTGGNFSLPSSTSLAGVTIAITCPTDADGSNPIEMLITGDIVETPVWEICENTKDVNVTSGAGSKTINIKWRDSNNNETTELSKTTQLAYVGEELLTISERTNLENNVGGGWEKCYDRAENGANPIKNYCNGATDYLVVWKQQNANAFAAYVGNGQCLPLDNCIGNDFVNNLDRLKLMNLTSNIIDQCNYNGMMHWGSTVNTTWNQYGLNYCFHMGNGMSIDNLNPGNTWNQIYCNQQGSACTSWAPTHSSIPYENYMMYKR